MITTDITVIGDANVDVITSKISSYPEKDAQILVQNMGISSGGCAANFAKAISRLGLNTRLIAKLGDDLFKDFVIKSLEREGIDLHITKGKSKTGITFAITFQDNSRSFITYPGANSELSVEYINLKLIEGKYLHIASFFLQGLRERTLDLLKYAHSKGMITTFDTGWDPHGWREKDVKLIRKVLSEVDIFFPNVREGQAITQLKDKEDICEELLSLGPQIIALKLGSKGSFIATKEDKECSFIPPYKIETEKVVDTTGAGDVFNAAFVYGHFHSWNLERIGKFANILAALSTLGYGSENYPTLKEVKRLFIISGKKGKGDVKKEK
jgi:sugar/nucleoside kinase (ribokinase family)